MVTAIFPAAGQSKRMNLNSSINKNFLNIEGKPLIVHTLLTFSQSTTIDNLIVAVSPNEMYIFRKMVEGVKNLKPLQIVAGGSERQYSIANALKVLSDDTDIVLVHDAARPLVSIKTIDEVVEAAKVYGGAIAAVPVKDTIKVVDTESFVTDTPPRASLVAVQTPQGFKRDILLKAYAQAEHDNFLGTDDASLVERIGVKVKVVMSDYRNIKITTPEDILIAKTFFNK